MSTRADTDPEDLAAVVENVRRRLQFTRHAQGYGEVLIRIQVCPQGIAD